MSMSTDNQALFERDTTLRTFQAVREMLVPAGFVEFSVEFSAFESLVGTAATSWTIFGFLNFLSLRCLVMLPEPL